MSEQVVCVVGLGYIGLPTALILAAYGNIVIGVDQKREVINQLKAGQLTFQEEGIEALYEKARQNKIHFQIDYPKADVYIVAVPTPYKRQDKKVDSTYLKNAVKAILDISPDESIIVIESTISPGTIDAHIRPLVGKKNVYLAHAPERIIPGNMIYELKNNNRVVGADTEEVADKIKHLYRTFCGGDIITTDIRTAEMSKVVENTYRDVNIAFANELAKICRSAKLDVQEIIRIANMHPRVNILSPGPGVGGHCISVDPWFLVGDYPGLANIILAARKINDSMPEFVLERTWEIMKENHIDDVEKVGFYGLTYKEDVDDIRESPTLQLLENMEKHLCGGVKVYDPYIRERIVKNQYFDFNHFLEGIDLVVIMVGHSEIREQAGMLREKIVLDTRNVIHLPDVYRL